MKIFYHDDIDGIGAAAMVYRSFIGQCSKEDFVMYSYSTPFPSELVSEGETVFIVDLSFSENSVDKLKEILDKKCNLIWCDHHTSTMELIEKYPEYNEIKGLRDSSCSGAALTYMYLENCKFADCPKFVRMISDFDCWQFKIDGTLQFKYALEARKLTPFEKIWDYLLRDSLSKRHTLLEDMIEEGKAIEKYMEQWFENYRNSYSYESEINGIKCLVCNIRANSLVFGDKIKDYPLVAIFVYDGEKYKYSIYSDKEDIDCSKIAESFGGGGHKGAAGFTTNKQIFIKKEN